MQVSLCWWSVNCCVQACKQTQRDTQGTKRAKCAHVGDTNNNYRTMFESRISAGATEKLPCSEHLRISSWSSDIEGHAKKCVEQYCELANKTAQ